MTQQTTSEQTEHAAPREAWDAIAEGYDRYVAPQEVELANEALALVGLAPGERFLDVAAGPWPEPSGSAARSRGHGDRLVARDDRAVRGACPGRGPRNSRWPRHELLRPRLRRRHLRCQRIAVRRDARPRPGARPPRAGARDEVGRPRRPDRLSATGGLEFLRLFVGALHAVVPDFQGIPGRPPPLEFQVADPEVLGRRLADAGLRDVEVVPSAERNAFRSGRECGTG